MAGPSQSPPSASDMSSITSLVPASRLMVRAFGRNDSLTFLLVGRDESNAIIFNAAVKESKGEIVVKNIEGEVMFSTFGGLSDMNEKMDIYSSLNDFSQQTGIVEGHQVKDMTEMDPHLQFTMLPNDCLSNNSLKILQQKDLAQPECQRLSACKVPCGISGNYKSAAVIIHFGSPRELSPLKKAILMMAGLKLFYCLYNFHHQPMPTEIPCHMPPAVPSCPSLELLHPWSLVKMRYSCCVSNTRWFVDILDGCTFAPLLIADITFHNTELETMFKDTFGVTQFRFEKQASANTVQVFDYHDAEIGTVASKEYTREGRIIMQRKYVSPFSPAHSGRVFQVTLKTVKQIQAEFFLSSECHMMYIRMNDDLRVEKKALLLADAVATSILYNKFLTDVYSPSVDAYPFRRTS